MSAIDAVSLALVLALAGYLVFALYPERFK